MEQASLNPGWPTCRKGTKGKLGLAVHSLGSTIRRARNQTAACHGAFQDTVKHRSPHTPEHGSLSALRTSSTTSVGHSLADGMRVQARRHLVRRGF